MKQTVKLTHVVERVLCNPWLITPGGYMAIQKVLLNKLDNVQSGVFDFLVDETEQEKLPLLDANKIATLQISGSLGQRLSLMEKSCGGADYLDFTAQAQDAVRQGARGLFAFIDSGGGMVIGLPELANTIKSLPIPTASYTDTLACSAAYWIGSSAKDFRSSSMALTGSIGVILPWEDTQAIYDGLGIKYQPITNEGATLKTAGAGPSLTDEQRAFLQMDANHVAQRFHEHVKSQRPNVNGDVFRAGTYRGDPAVEMGLLDGVCSKEEAYDRLLTKTKTVVSFSPGNASTGLKQAASKGKHMTKEELQAQHPDLYKELSGEILAAANSAATEERERITKINSFRMDGIPEIDAAVQRGVEGNAKPKEVMSECYAILRSKYSELSSTVAKQTLKSQVQQGAAPLDKVRAIDNPAPTTEHDEEAAEQARIKERLLKAGQAERAKKNGVFLAR